MSFKTLKYGKRKKPDRLSGYIYNLCYSMGYDFDSHIHSCYEFIHILKGQFLYSTEGNDYFLQDGDLIVTTPGKLHSFSFPKECEYYREVLHIYPDFISDYPSLLNTLNSRCHSEFNYIKAEYVKKYGIDKIFSGIEEYCSSPVPETDFMVLTYTLQLISKINQITRAESPKPAQLRTNEKVTSIRSYIDTHYRKDITLSDIASATFLSPAHASRAFKRDIGITIKAYINLRRIILAKNLIMEGKKATSIYSACGFRDYSTFYRAFLKYTGMTPEEFKTQNFTKTEPK